MNENDKTIVKSSRLELAKLITENPDAELLIEIDTYALDGGYAIEIKKAESARLDEYVLDRRDHIHYKSNEDVCMTLESYVPIYEIEKLPETYGECKVIYEKLPWKKAIIVTVD